MHLGLLRDVTDYSAGSAAGVTARCCFLFIAELSEYRPVSSVAA